VKGDKVQTACGVAWNGWEGGDWCSWPEGQSPRGWKIGGKNK